jgi:hypothetical protein
MEIKIKIQERKTSEPVQKMVQSGCVLPRHLEMVELPSMALMKTGVETVCQEGPARQLLGSKVQDEIYEEVKTESREDSEFVGASHQRVEDKVAKPWELHLTRPWERCQARTAAYGCQVWLSDN